MINYRESRRTISTLRVDNLCQNQHENPPRRRLPLVGNRAGRYTFERLLASFCTKAQWPVPLGENSFQLREPSTNKSTLSSRISVVKSDLKKPAINEASLKRGRFMTRQGSLGRGYQQNLQTRVGRRCFNSLVEAGAQSPFNEAIGRVPPLQPERRKQRLSGLQKANPMNENSADKKPTHSHPQLTANQFQFKFISNSSHLIRSKRGSVLVEAIIALSLLLVVSLIILKGTMNILAPRQWTMVQNVSDAYLSYEKAFAQRIPFESLTGSSSPWPVYPAKSEDLVTLGTLPGGRTLTGNVIRTRMPDGNNLPAFGGEATTATNPAEMQTWILQSHVTYRISGRDYVKSRTIVRTQ